MYSIRPFLIPLHGRGRVLHLLHERVPLPLHVHHRSGNDHRLYRRVKKKSGLVMTRNSKCSLSTHAVCSFHQEVKGQRRALMMSMMMMMKPLDLIEHWH